MKSNLFKYKTILISFFLFLFAIFSFFYMQKNEKIEVDYKGIATPNIIHKTIDKTKIQLIYPTYNILPLDEFVTNYINEQTLHLDSIKHLNINIKTDIFFDQYITLEFLKDTDNNVISTHIIFDKKNDKILTLNDIFRGNYPAMIAKYDPQYICNKNNNNLSLDSSHIYLYQNNTSLMLVMEEVKNYIRLDNINIPSLYPHDIIPPTTQQIDPNKPMIAFTFDDGPHPENTPKIIELFEQYNGRATFFVLGSLATKYKDIIVDAYQRGFEIDNHSWSHQNLVKIPIDQAYDEIHHTSDAIFSITGKDPLYLRPPYGSYNNEIKQIANYMDIQLWNIDTEDWKYKNANVVTRNILKNAKDNSVILVHDIHKSTLEGIKNALPKLQEQGYQFVTLETLHKYRK